MQNRPMERIRTIGQGGLGVVSLYQATDGSFYAVKQMKFVWNETLFHRFKIEIEILRSLVHKNIVRILNFDTLNQNPWYVMPYFKDGNLRDKLMKMQSEGNVFSVNAACSIIYYLADALAYAHSKNIIHRDLKPENILFSGNEPIIADWGIGKFIHRESQVLTAAGLGTKLYCAPEQWENGIADRRSDIYSLGIIFRELLTGSVYGEIIDQRVRNIVNRMTMMSPTDRYQTIQQIMQDIALLGTVNTLDPMKAFWDGAGKLAIGLGLAYLLAKAFE